MINSILSILTWWMVILLDTLCNSTYLTRQREWKNCRSVQETTHSIRCLDHFSPLQCIVPRLAGRGCMVFRRIRAEEQQRSVWLQSARRCRRSECQCCPCGLAASECCTPCRDDEPVFRRVRSEAKSCNCQYCRHIDTCYSSITQCYGYTSRNTCSFSSIPMSPIKIHVTAIRLFIVINPF